MFTPLTALQELRLEKQAATLLPKLLQPGVAWEQATALAYNTVLLSLVLQAEPPLSPEDILATYDLNTIADLCRQYAATEQEDFHDTTA